jgi:hypothetical protein
MPSYQFIDTANEMLLQLGGIGTIIVAVVDQDDQLRVAQVLKTLDRNQRNQANEDHFDSVAWWDLLHVNRLTVQITGTCRLARALGSTGEYMGALLEEVLEMEDHLIVLVDHPAHGLAVHSFRWHDRKNEDSTEFVPPALGGDKAMIVPSFVDNLLHEISASDADRALMKKIMESTAMEIPLSPGTRPKEFYMNDKGCIDDVSSRLADDDPPFVGAIFEKYSEVNAFDWSQRVDEQSLTVNGKRISEKLSEQERAASAELSQYLAEFIPYRYTATRLIDQEPEATAFKTHVLACGQCTSAMHDNEKRISRSYICETGRNLAGVLGANYDEGALWAVVQQKEMKMKAAT